MWIGDTAFVVLLSAGNFQAYRNPWSVILMAWQAVMLVAILWTFRRCGLLSFAAFYFVNTIMVIAPVVWSSWYLGRALVIHLIPLAISAWAVWVVLPAQKWASGSESAA
jgi:hypothetical protein